jgi:hypothetical protein
MYNYLLELHLQTLVFLPKRIHLPPQIFYMRRLIHETESDLYQVGFP